MSRYLRGWSSAVIDMFSSAGLADLKQVALACHNFHDAFKHLPPGVVTTASTGVPDQCWAWGTLILPYVEQAPLYAQLNPKLNPPNTAPPSSNTLSQTLIPVYISRRCICTPRQQELKVARILRPHDRMLVATETAC